MAERVHDVMAFLKNDAGCAYDLLVDVTAVDYCQFLTIGREDFQRFLAKHPELAAKIGEVAAGRAAINTAIEDPTDPSSRPPTV